MNINDLPTIEELQREFQWEPKPTKKERFKKAVAGLFEYLEMFAWSVAFVLLIFTFGVRLCRVDGESMQQTLQHQEMLLLSSTGYTPQQDDIVVFHLTQPEDDLEKTLVKRVIAVGGQEIEINTKTGEITIDGVPYEDEHAVFQNMSGYNPLLFGHHFDAATGIFHAIVPEHTVFVMGDNRNNSKDSRNPQIGFVDERCILGRVFLRFDPFTVFS